MTSRQDLTDRLAGQRIVVTGCSGTVGSELLDQLIAADVDSVVGLDHDEAGLFFQDIRFREEGRISFHLSNVRDRPSLTRHFKNADLVIHTAALKHVPLCEDAPHEAIQTNIVGTQNVVEAAIEQEVGRLLFTSTDKAVNPTNVMGTSKLMAERLVTAAATQTGVLASTTRFGNVLGSSGSVIPVFRRQILDGGPVTVTDPAMTRFVMTLGDATRLVLESAFVAEPGDVVITKMPVANIGMLAEVMVQELAPAAGFSHDEIVIESIGPRPGEKRYEELMNEEEVRRAFDIGDFLVVRPALSDTPGPALPSTRPDRPYNSHEEPPLSRDELTEFLRSNELLRLEET